MKRFLVISAVVFAAVGMGAGVATAGPAPTPDGWCGALNMLHDSTMGSVPMARDNPNGNIGMFHAVDVSGCKVG